MNSQEVFLCDHCFPRLRINNAPCPVCGVPQQYKTPCLSCLFKPPPFRRTLAPFLYAPPLSSAICELKYEKRIHFVREIALLWLQTLKGQFLTETENFSVCPVPLHHRRLLKRGFNQSHLLAYQIFGKRKVKDLLVRHRATIPQVALSRQERLRNVRGAFKVRPGAQVAGKKILLFDDIFTTGATLRECAKVLRNAGAAEVWVAVIARAE